MSKLVSTVIPDDVRASKSKRDSMVHVVMVVQIPGDLPGDPRAEQRYSLTLDQAEDLARQLQSRSAELRDDLAREAPLGKDPENDDDQLH
ncbi:MAG: hypothetical protein OXC14_08860 [Rhodospirillaceae bacterium]|nr:hypothetical protein [Rhodospirillaceae bacterium]